MGIDIYLEWDGQTEEDRKKMCTGFSTMAGDVGYLREAYHGGPYATQILVREAFEAEDCKAEIPAAVMRDRLTGLTEPARNCDGGHRVAAMLVELMTSAGMDVDTTVKSGRTDPMSVEEAVRARYKALYPDEPEEHVERVVQSFRDFVALAERKEKETGKPCTVIASY